MPFARAKDGVRLFYEVAGGGPDAQAVLLVMGLGVRGELWGSLRDALAADGYRVLTMDNRGIGQSRSPSLTLTTTTMAEDAIAVMETASVRHAHVVGTSLGGMVAQQLALQHPQSVDALILQSTTAGMRRVSLVPTFGLPRLAAFLGTQIAGHPVEQRARAVLRLLTTELFAGQAPLTDPRLRPLLDAFTTGGSFIGQAAQLRAAWNHNTWTDLQRITAPTLVQHGMKDRMISVRAGRAIADRVPGALLEVYRDTGHLVAIERPESIDALRDFLRRCADEPRLCAAAPGTS